MMTSASGRVVSSWCTGDAEAKSNVREFGYAVIDERKSCGFPVGWRRVVGSWWAMGESWAVEGLQNMSRGNANRIASDHNLMSFSSKPWDPGRKSGGASANH